MLTALSADQLRERIGIVEKVPEHKAVCVALLAHDDRLHLDTHLSLAQAMPQVAEKGWGFSYLQRSGDSMVARGRSFLASQFLTRPDIRHCTDLVFIDTDLSWKSDELVRLCSHPVDVVGGAYPFKDDSGFYPTQWPSEGVRETKGLWSMKAVTPGFFRITRRALEKMAKEMPWLEFKDRGNKGDERSFMFFDNLHRPTGIYDEGYVFCERWRGVGGSVYLDPDLDITHIGLKKYNHGTIRGFLDKKAVEFEELEKRYPSVPQDRLMASVMGSKIDLEVEAREHEVNGGNPHPRAARFASFDSLLHTRKSQPRRYHPVDIGGRRRPDYPGLLAVASEGQAHTNLYRAA